MNLIEGLTTWLHRLHCVAWAFRGGNSTMTLAGGTRLITASCQTCGDMRILESGGGLSAGQVFWSPDR